MAAHGLRGGPGVSTDRPGRPTSDRGPKYARALTEYREALELPTVGTMRRAAELEELGRLIDRYTEEARNYLAELDRREADRHRRRQQ
jgi:hypothetical protein